MAGSYLNIITFLLTTVFYYFALNPTITIEHLTNKDKFEEYTKNHYIYLGVYVLLVILVQVVVNINVITTTCGGNIADNIGSAGLVTIIPWALIFGAVVIILVIYPGFKTAFSDVIGYFYISSSANKILSTILIDQDVQNELDKDTESTPEQKKAMQTAAQTILKICGNPSILINQMSPTNFLKYWNVLTPLMKPEYQDQSNTTPSAQSLPSEPPSYEDAQQLGGSGTDYKQQLFDLVVSKDNVGEAMWFVYTGVLLTSIVQLKITNKGCASNSATMQQNYQKFLTNENQSKTKQQQATSTVYTITN